MKLIRLTDQRYILDAGPNLTQQQAEQIKVQFNDWWRTDHTDVPLAIIVGGDRVELEYEDRREPDIEGRLRLLENHVHGMVDKQFTGEPLKGESDAQDEGQEGRQD